MLITRVLIITIIVFLTYYEESANALRCLCNTQHGPSPCVNSVCEADMKYYQRTKDHRESVDATADDEEEEEEVVVPYCAAIRSSERGDYFSCTFAAGGGGKTPVKCTTEIIESGGGDDDDDDEKVVVDRCWCNNRDFCNDDVLEPNEAAFEDADVKETSTSTSTTTRIAKQQQWDHSEEESTTTATSTTRLDTESTNIYDDQETITTPRITQNTTTLTTTSTIAGKIESQPIFDDEDEKMEEKWPPSSSILHRNPLTNGDDNGKSNAAIAGEIGPSNAEKSPSSSDKSILHRVDGKTDAVVVGKNDPSNDDARKYENDRRNLVKLHPVRSRTDYASSSNSNSADDDAVEEPPESLQSSESESDRRNVVVGNVAGNGAEAIINGQRALLCLFSLIAFLIITTTMTAFPAGRIHYY